MKMLAMRLCVTLWCVQQVGVNQIAKQMQCVCATQVCLYKRWELKQLQCNVTLCVTHTKQMQYNSTKQMQCVCLCKRWEFIKRCTMYTQVGAHQTAKQM